MMYKVVSIEPDLNSYGGSVLDLKPIDDPPPNFYAGHVQLRTVDARFSDQYLVVGSIITIDIGDAWKIKGKED